MQKYREIVQYHPMNKSSSKQMYSFGLGERFKMPKRSHENDRFYVLPELKTGIIPTFGHGDRNTNMTRDRDIPPPGTYYIKSEFDDKNRGPSIGGSRQQVKFNSLTEGVNHNKNPGPGSYNLGTTINNRTFTMKGRSYDYQQQKVSQRSPGPSNYNTSLSMSGRMTLSKFRYRGGAIINPISNTPQKKDNQPGPGQYKVQETLGQSITTKYRSYRGVPFNQVQRTTSNHKRVNDPGPGHYKQMSEFGFYEHDHLKDKRDKQRLQIKNSQINQNTKQNNQQQNEISINNQTEQQYEVESNHQNQNDKYGLIQQIVNHYNEDQD